MADRRRTISTGYDGGSDNDTDDSAGTGAGSINRGGGNRDDDPSPTGSDDDSVGGGTGLGDDTADTGARGSGDDVDTGTSRDSTGGSRSTSSGGSSGGSSPTRSVTRRETVTVGVGGEEGGQIGADAGVDPALSGVEADSPGGNDSVLDTVTEPVDNVRDTLPGRTGEAFAAGAAVAAIPEPTPITEGVGTTVAAGAALTGGAILAGRAVRDRSGELEIGERFPNELDTGRPQRDVSELEIGTGSGPEVEPGDTTPQPTEVGTGSGVTRSEIEIGETGGSTATGQQDETVVPDEFPLPGRDIARRPDQEAGRTPSPEDVLGGADATSGVTIGGELIDPETDSDGAEVTAGDLADVERTSDLEEEQRLDQIRDQLERRQEFVRDESDFDADRDAFVFPGSTAGDDVLGRGTNPETGTAGGLAAGQFGSATGIGAPSPPPEIIGGEQDDDTTEPTVPPQDEPTDFTPTDTTDSTTDPQVEPVEPTLVRESVTVDGVGVESAVGQPTLTETTTATEVATDTAVEPALATPPATEVVTPTETVTEPATETVSPVSVESGPTRRRRPRRPFDPDDPTPDADPLPEGGALGADFINPARGVEAASADIVEGLDDLEDNGPP